MLAHKEGFIVIGGSAKNNKMTSLIAKFDNGTWSQLGNLLSKRTSHSAIFDGLSYLIVGGYTGRDINLTNVFRTF